jgi:hypothetical protein
MGWNIIKLLDWEEEEREMKGARSKMARDIYICVL